MQNQEQIILNDSQSKLVIDPMVGGALVNFDFKGPQGWIPILRPGNLFQRSGPSAWAATYCCRLRIASQMEDSKHHSVILNYHPI